MRSILIFVLSIIFTLGLCNNIIPGAYPGELYTNSFQWVTSPDFLAYGMAYSPDAGRTLDITITSDMSLFNGELLPLASPGLCYLNYDDYYGNGLFLVQNWGDYLSTIAWEFGFFEIVQSGFVLNQVFMIDYDQDTHSSTLYRSDQAGYDAYAVCNFDSTEVTAITMGVNTGEIFLTAFDYRDNLLHLLYSSNMGNIFTDYPFPDEIMNPYPVGVGGVKYIHKAMEGYTSVDILLHFQEYLSYTDAKISFRKSLLYGNEIYSLMNGYFWFQYLPMILILSCKRYFTG